MKSGQKRIVAVVGVVAFVGLLAAMTVKESQTPDQAYGERPGAQKQVMAQAARQNEAPYRLGGLERREMVRGAEALAEVARLHGKGIGLIDGLVARYGPEGGGATLWVGWARSPEAARKQVSQMTEGIRAGGSPFTEPKEEEFDGRSVFTLSGMGQRHAYFAAGSRTVWMAADSGVFQEALKDALDRYRE